jgi:CBS domain-containing protein
VGGPGGIVGLITSHEIKGLARDRWVDTPLSDVMRPIDQLRVIQPDMLAIDALKLMGQEDVNQLPVMSEGTFKGMIGRSHILQLLQVRAELKMPTTPNTAVPLTVPRAAATPVS